MIEKIHSHRNLIGFDENGIPTVTHPATDHHHEQAHPHDDGSDDDAFIRDYMAAIGAYKQTFPTRDEQIEQTPDPAVREMLIRQKQLGIDTTFDRFDKQKPQCNFGLAGVCCKNCNMGPCRITAKAKRGICGADADLIVARNLLRAAAAGAAQHGVHGRELMLELKWAAEGKLDVPLLGEQKIKDTAAAFGIPTAHRKLKSIAADLADALLSDLSNPDPAKPYKTIEACAPPERAAVWRALDLVPISAYHEVFEAYHKTGVGTDGDWKSILQQMLRCGLAFTFSGVVGTSIATDGLFGVGDRVTSKVNIGALKKGYVNIAVHGHLPFLVKAIVKAGQSEKIVDLAKRQGAKGIRFYGICCSGLSAMYRYAGVIPLSNAVSAELVLGTGALDLWVADVQDVFPAIMDVARCTQTAVVTTSASARLPGAERFEYDRRHSNIGETEALAEKIVMRGIQSFADRRGVPVYIPPYEVEAEVGFSVEYVHKRFGSMAPVAEALRDGRILGVVNMVGCNNPKVPYERCIADVAEMLVKNNVLVLSNGCASYPLMKLGYCSKAGRKKAGEALRDFLAPDLPPVWHVGECIDNTRSSGIMAGIAAELGVDLPAMPYAFSSPEWSNEKGLDAAMGFRLLGVSSYHCVEAPIFGSKNVIEFLKEGTRETLGSVMRVNVDPKALGEQIVADMKAKRAALGWDKK
ncbi:anaerobic carbon-monoxide dehydrogenase catalytic subunit [Pseudoramibacter alactolyticus]